GNRTALVRTAERNVGPIRFKPELPIRPRKTVEIMRFPERGLTVDPLVGLDLGKRAPFRNLQHLVDEFARTHRKPSMFGTKPLCQPADDFVITAALAWWLDQLGSEDEILMPASAIDIIVFEKRCCRQNEVRDLRRFRHELLMHTDKEIFARKP